MAPADREKASELAVLVAELGLVTTVIYRARRTVVSKDTRAYTSLEAVLIGNKQRQNRKKPAIEKSIQSYFWSDFSTARASE
jgi:hypothetical protein